MNLTCSGCRSKLRVPDALAGKKAKCPKCGAILEVAKAPEPEAEPTAELATERQKEYARSLGVEFPANITKTEMRRLISSAVDRRDEERFRKLDELSDRESRAREEMREQVLAEIDEEDCRLSKATPAQMLEELANRNLGAILISFDMNEVDFENLTGARFPLALACSDNMAEHHMNTILMGLGWILAKKAKR
jgi:gamma-glutamylcyclotransferase (GGCT)/AIG2-like uncharacterized protein YtfP